jgi:hypothetical protein
MNKENKLIKATLFINYNDVESIKKAEIRQNKLINKGLILYETLQIGFNKFKITFI